MISNTRNSLVPHSVTNFLNAGYKTLDLPTTSKAKLHFPVVLSEWGFIQNGTYWNQITYSKYLMEFMEKLNQVVGCNGSWEGVFMFRREMGGVREIWIRRGEC